MDDKLLKVGGLAISAISLIYFPLGLLVIIPAILFFQISRYNSIRSLKQQAESYIPPSESYWKEKNILFLINPASGGKNANDRFKFIVEPMMRKAGVKLEPIVTNSSKHVRYVVI